MILNPWRAPKTPQRLKNAFLAHFGTFWTVFERFIGKNRWFKVCAPIFSTPAWFGMALNGFEKIQKFIFVVLK